jgi:hypothetical protein
MFLGIMKREGLLSIVNQSANLLRFSTEETGCYLKYSITVKLEVLLCS